MKKKVLAAFAITLALALPLTACGSASYSAQSDSAGAVSEETTEYEISADEVADVAEEDAGDGMTDSVEIEDVQSEEKIIYTYNYTVETKTFDDFMSSVQSRIDEYGGYLESSSVNGNEQMNISRYAELVIRIPADRMHDFLQMVEENSNVTYSSSGSENVTLTYVDLESHIKALKTEQQTLMDLLEKAESTEDVIYIQSQLTNVRYELESYESQLRVYDNRVNYSTLYLDISEVDRESSVATKLTYGEEVKQGLSDTMYRVGRGLRSFSIWLIVNLPILLILAVIVVIVVLIVRKLCKRHEARSARKPSGSGIWSKKQKEDKADEYPDQEK